jgi:hypothetical protein
MNNKQITILSTFADDILVNKTEAIIRQQPGGPAFYIKQVLEKEKISFNLKTGSKMKVEILITPTDEYGKIKTPMTPQRIQFNKIETPLLLISTILDEYDLTTLPLYKGNVFLDIQGFVRNGKDFGKRQNWKPNIQIFENIFCIKGTDKELNHIPTKYIKKQKQKILLITKGKYGCEVFSFGKHYIIKPKKTIKTDDTIGAGDTFLAYFIAKFTTTKDALKSTKYAVQKTSDFLLKKNKHT